MEGVNADFSAVAGCACALCAAAPAHAEQAASARSASTSPGDGAYGEAVSALLSGVKWAGTSLSFSFPDSTSDYAYRGYLSVRDTFAPATEALASAARAGFEFYASVSGLDFTEFTGAADRDADLMIGRSAAPGTAFAYFPFSGDEGGDAWFNTRDYNAPVAGDYAWATVLHEIGHALGLKHGHETGGGGALPFALDSHEYSLMTYRSYVGSSGSFYTNGAASGPQTPMMLDIAAIQRLYGANYDYRAGDDVYAFSPGAGSLTVNGVMQEPTAGDVIFRTIWDGGGEDVYDLSAFGRALAIDLAPGGHVDLDRDGTAQRAFLGGGVHAVGHVFNALEHEGDARSLIEHAIGGSAADVIRGNRAGNRLEGRGGDDTLEGLTGADTLLGGAGADSFRFDLSETDGAADLILDLDFAEGDRIELLGLSAGAVSALASAGIGAEQGGAAASLTSFEDLIALERAALATLSEAAGGAASLTLSAGAASRTLILGSVPLANLHALWTPPDAGPASGDSGTMPDLLAFSVEAPPDMPGAPAEEGVPDAPAITREDDPAGDTPDLRPDIQGDPVAPPPPARLVGAAKSEVLDGGATADVIAGRGGADMVRGRGGDDTLKGQAGADTLRGGAGDDDMRGGGAADRAQGGGGADVLRGQRGDDVLNGGAGDDVIDGGSGADRINGQRGDDVLTGGAGGDLFVFAGRFGDDVITDFAAGGDRIGLRGIAADFDSLDIRFLDGDAVVRLSAGTITIIGVSPDALGADDFLF